MQTEVKVPLWLAKKQTDMAKILVNGPGADEVSRR